MKQDLKIHTLIANKRGGDIISTILDPLSESFIQKGQGIYVWCNESQLENVISGKISKLKVGQYGTNALEGQTPHDTIRGYSGPTTESQVIVYSKKLSISEIKRSVSAFAIEQKFHSKNKYRKTKNGSSNEGYSILLSEVIQFFSEEIYGTSKDLDNYGLRPSQFSAKEKMGTARSFGSKDFLLGAVMRFGKNFTYLADCLDYVPYNGNILVLTSRPKVFSSLKKDIESHVWFQGMNFVSLKDKKDWVPSEDKIDVVAISKQLWDNKNNREWMKSLVERSKFDSVMIDEAHTGTETDRFTSEILPSLYSIQFRVWCSGTPFKKIASGRFNKINSFFYDYIDQQRDKKAGLIKAVSLTTYVPYVDPSILNDPRFSDDEGFKFGKFLGVDQEGRLIHEGYVKSWVLNLLGQNGIKTKYSPYLIKSSIKNSIALCPGVGAIKALAKIINEIPGFYAIPATDNEITDMEEVDAIISRKEIEGIKTITLTCSRFVEGSTEPRWDSGFLFSDTRGLEKYLQFIFRPTSLPKCGEKDEAYIFDFDPQRALEMNFEQSLRNAKKEGNTDANSYLREYLDCHPIYLSGNGPGFKKLTIEEFIQRVRETDYSVYQMQRGVEIDVSKISKDLAYSLSEEDWKHHSPKKKFEISNSGINGKTYESQERASSDKMEKDSLAQAIENIKIILGFLPISACTYEVGTIEKLVSVMDRNVWEDLSGVDMDWLNILLDKGIIDVDDINIILAQFGEL
jgi:hypothetical protein